VENFRPSERDHPRGPFHLLTDDLQVDEEAPDGLGADLAFVPSSSSLKINDEDFFPPPSRVSLLRLLDLEDPLVRLRLVDALEALVRRVGEHAHGQNVQIVVANPGDLEE